MISHDAGRLLFVMMALPSEPDAAQVGGSAKSPFRLLRWIAPSMRRVHVVATAGNRASLPPNCSGTVVRIGFARLFVRTLLQSIFIGLHLARCHGRYDIVQSHHPHLSAGIAIVRKLGLWRGTFVLKAHGTAVPELKTNTHKGFKRILLELNARILHHNDVFALREADFVICSSQYQKTEMRELYHVAEEKLVVIYNGYDPLVRATALEPPPVQSRRMVFCGRVVEKKNAPYAIALFRRLKEEGLVDGLDLVLGHAVRIENRDVLERIRAAIGGDPSIIIHHDLEESELYRLFARAVLGVVPSLDYESIPSVIYEIAACGTPVFATGQWGIPEVLPEPYWLSLNVGSDVARIKRVLGTDHENRDHCDWAEMFRYDRLAEQYFTLYRKGGSI